MKKYKLGIIGVFIIILFSGIFVFANVNAQDQIDSETERESTTEDEGKEKDKTEVNDEVCDSVEKMREKATVKYAAEIIEKENNGVIEYYITLSPTKQKLKQVQFRLIKIGDRNITGGFTIKGGQEKKLDIIDNENYSDFKSVSEGTYKNTHKQLTIELDTYDDPDCGHLIIVPDIIVPKQSEIDHSTSTDVEYDLPEHATNQIDCTKNQTNKLSQAFCYIKGKANGTITLAEGKSFAKENKKSMKCNTDPFPDDNIDKDGKDEFDKIMYGADASKEDYYLAKNRQYYHASSTKTLEASKGELEAYEYHFSPGKTEKDNSASCKIKCEEAVVVEYGAPVASHAGLCFDYKVKVTSIVSCSMVTKPKGYKRYSGYCTPSPVCTNGKAYFTEGGPNEEFDQCINKCDGGKYTQKCSKKCYEKVYNKTKTANKELKIDTYKDISPTLLNTVTDGITKFDLEECIKNTLKNPEKYGYNGCYYRADGKIYFKKNKNDDDWGKPAGRWYYESGTKNYGEYDPDWNGIYRHDYGTTHCKDTCWWKGCKGKYLNPEYAEKDAELNDAVYQRNIKKCRAAASCTEKTAEFSIKIKYNTTDQEATAEPITVTYPFTELGDTGNTTKLHSQNTTGTEKKNPEASEKPPILAYAGCYQENAADNWYQTEWSFPGTWISGKTGEISFKPVNKNGWYKDENRFCIPLNARSVNKDWWNWYMQQTAPEDSPYMQEDETDKCANKIKNAVYADPKKWNINAIARNFGYFGWNFDISCFYALNNNPGDTPECEQGLEYRVRTVDNNDLFPSKEGKETNTSIKTNKTGRTPGFNWSKEATISHEKNANYAVNPSALIGRIQEVGDGIYKETKTNESKYLDYHFKLTPETLRDIKENVNGKNSYYSLNGKFYMKNGVSVYESTLIRTGRLSSKKITLKVGNIGCNNDAGKSCETFELMGD